MSAEAVRSARMASMTRLWHGRHAGLVAGLAVIVVVGVVVIALPSLAVNGYTLSIVYTIAFYTVVAQSWNIMSGFTGYFSFAHGALVGVGSYAGIVAVNHGANMPVMIAAGMAAAFVVSMVIGIPSLRLRGIAFAFATVFFQLIMLSLTKKGKGLTQGSQGLVSVRLAALPELLTAMTILAMVATALVLVLRRTRTGLKLLAIKDDETAAAIIGIPTVRLKLSAFGVSALIAGAAGAVHGLFLSTLFPDTVFALQGSLEPVVIAMVGGPGSAFGPVVMAIVYGVSQESVRGLGAGIQLVALGAVLVIAVLFARNGLAGLLVSWRARQQAGKESQR